MLNVGECVIYGSHGLCRVQEILVPSFLERGNEKQYYMMVSAVDAGSVLSVTVAADGSVPSLGLLGDLTFPDAMNFSVVRNGNYSSGTIVLSAAGSVSGGTTMTPAAGSDKAKMSVNAAARLVSLVKSGCVYIFR